MAVAGISMNLGAENGMFMREQTDGGKSEAFVRAQSHFP
jgi:hypothetical protein